MVVAFANLDQFQGTAGTGLWCIGGLDDDLESAVVERFTRSGLHADQALALAFACKLQRTKVTVRVVAGAPENRVGRERAAARTGLCERTLFAQNPHKASTCGEGPPG